MTDKVMNLDGSVVLSPKDVLDLPLSSSVQLGPNVKTIRSYLKCLCVKIIEEGESFSGKRPFGNSGWEHDLYDTLLEANMVKGNIVIYESDGETYVEHELKSGEHQKAAQIIINAINAMN